MVITNRSVLLILVCVCIAEIFCVCHTSKPLLETKDCLKNSHYTVATIKLNHSRNLVRAKREPPEATVAYYDFLVNEFSFKVWAVFEMVTIGLLFYSTFAAIYYARWTYLRTDFSDADDLFLRRSHERLIRALQNPPR